MTQGMLTRGAHLADGDIVRYHDGECSQIEWGRIARHLAECSRCAATARFFETTSRQFDVSLEEMEIRPSEDAKQKILAARDRITHAAKPRLNRRGTQLLRAAAVVFALIAAGSWAPPVRAWFVELLTPVSTPSPESGQADEEGRAANRASSVVSFVPSGPAFVIDIATKQTGGSLAIRIGDGNVASVRVTGRASTDSVQVAGNGIRIRNSTVSTATYEVAVPSSIRWVTVRVVGSARLSYTTAAIAARGSVVIALSR